MPRTAADTEDALEQATLALFRQMGWDTVNCMDEVFGDVPHSPRRPNLGRETTGEVVLPRLVREEVASLGWILR
jgi:type I restriction enzyme, R subunit